MSSESRDGSCEPAECPTCGRDDFASQRGMKIHHKRTHGESICGELVECDVCGTKVRRRSSALEKNDHVICSDECYSTFRQNSGGTDHPLSKKKEQTPCDWCGSTIVRRPSGINRRNFCSQGCNREWQSENVAGEDHPQWERVSVECEICGSEFGRIPSHNERVGRTFCSNACRGDGISGQDSHQWRGGQSIYHAILTNICDESWKQTRARIRERYDYTCFACGEKGADNIPVHHIIPILSGGCNADELLMPLCRDCHPTVEAFTREMAPSVFIDHYA